MAPAVRFPGKNLKRMECAANEVGLAPLCLNYSVLVNRSIRVYPGLNLPWLILQPATHTHVLNSGQEFENCQPSILSSPAPDGRIRLCILVMGRGLISFKICSTWTQMTVNGSCGTLHAVCHTIGMACSPAVNARCRSFYNELIKLPEGCINREPPILFPDKTFNKPQAGKKQAMFYFYNIHLNCSHLVKASGFNKNTTQLELQFTKVTYKKYVG